MFGRNPEIVLLFLIPCTCFLASCRLPDGLPDEAPPMQAWFVDVGQGDACLLRTPEGRDFLYDIGNQGEKLATFLTAAGVDTLEAVLISHPDLDHFGAFSSLQAFVVKRWYIPETKSPDPAWSGMIRTLDAQAARVETLHAGISLDWSDRLDVKVLWPPPLFSGSDNDLSVVIRITHGDGGASLLLTGDVESAGEAGLLASGYDLTADLLKVAHHGSRTSSSLPFLAAAAPRWAIISCDSSVYGHPHADTRAGLRRFLPEERILRTDEAGTVGFEIGGGGVRRMEE